jgi:TetR/AcrR family transcriptional regulator, cholesterol catabolism regulator
MDTRPRDGARTRTDIRAAAVALFYQHGYEATALRTLADEVGIKVGSLYNHMGGKDELLLDIMTTVMDQLLESSQAAVAAAGADPIDKLKALVDNHLRFHARNPRETFIGNSELRALSGENRRAVLGRRRDYETTLRTAIEDATASAGVKVLDARLQTYAVLALGMHLASWFRDSSEVSLEHVVEVYTELTLRQLGLD